MTDLFPVKQPPHQDSCMGALGSTRKRGSQARSWALACKGAADYESQRNSEPRQDQSGYDRCYELQTWSHGGTSENQTTYMNREDWTAREHKRGDRGANRYVLKISRVGQCRAEPCYGGDDEYRALARVQPPQDEWLGNYQAQCKNRWPGVREGVKSKI